jgi:hypothetical protein
LSEDCAGDVGSVGGVVEEGVVVEVEVVGCKREGENGGGRK